MGEIIKRKERYTHSISIGGYTLQKSDITFCYGYYGLEKNQVNSFVRSIHFVGFDTPKVKSKYFLFFYTTRNDIYTIQDQRIIDMFLNNARIFKTSKDIIILWNREKLCISSDLYAFQFYEGDDFFKKCIIHNILYLDNHDLIILKHKHKCFPEVKKIHSHITLLESFPIGISFSEYLSDF